MGEIVAVCTSAQKGVKKKNVNKGYLITNFGLKGDAHGGFMHRQVSLLALESIEKMQKMGLDVGPGDFAENLTTRGIDLTSLPVGTHLKVGENTILKVSQIGKQCHNRCSIYYQAGDCIMPKEGIFAEVIKEGEVKVGDDISILPRFKLGIITASDKGSRGEREDKSGEIIKQKLSDLLEIVDYRIVPDEKDTIKKVLIELVDELKLDLIITTGGTGLSPRDVTPEATLEVIDKEVPGIPEAIRWKSYQITPKAMLSRGIAGIRKKTLIINLPGSPKAVEECLDIVFPVLEHGLEILKGLGGECGRK